MAFPWFPWNMFFFLWMVQICAQRSCPSGLATKYMMFNTNVWIQWFFHLLQPANNSWIHHPSSRCFCFDNSLQILQNRQRIKPFSCWEIHHEMFDTCPMQIPLRRVFSIFSCFPELYEYIRIRIYQDQCCWHMGMCQNLWDEPGHLAAVWGVTRAPRSWEKVTLTNQEPLPLISMKSQ